MKKSVIAAALILACVTAFAQSFEKEFRIEKQYLNFPVDMQQDRQKVHFLLDEDTLTYSVIRIAEGESDYWVFKDVSAYKGKKLTMTFSDNVAGIEKIYQSDRF